MMQADRLKQIRWNLNHQSKATSKDAPKNIRRNRKAPPQPQQTQKAESQEQPFKKRRIATSLRRLCRTRNLGGGRRTEPQFEPVKTTQQDESSSTAPYITDLQVHTGSEGMPRHFVEQQELEPRKGKLLRTELQYKENYTEKVRGFASEDGDLSSRIRQLSLSHRRAPVLLDHTRLLSRRVRIRSKTWGDILSKQPAPNATKKDASQPPLHCIPRAVFAPQSAPKELSSELGNLDRDILSARQSERELRNCTQQQKREHQLSNVKTARPMTCRMAKPQSLTDLFVLSNAFPVVSSARHSSSR